MKEGNKTKKQLIDELVELRQRVAELEKLEVKQKRAEKRLKAAANEWRTTFDSASELIMLLDSEMKIIKANLATVKFLNIPFNEIIGKTCFKLFHGTDKPPDICPLVKAQKTKQHEKAELYLPEKDIWIFVSTNPIFDDKGNLTKTVHIMKDITKRKKAEEALRQSEEEYRAIFENTGTAMIMDKEDTTIVLANTEAEKLLGYSKEEIEGKSWTEFILKDDLEKLKEYHHLRRIDPKAAPKNYELRFIDKHGNVRDVFATVTMIPGTKKSVASLLDITERKRMGEALIQAHRDWEEIFQAIGHPTFMFDPEHNILLANRAAVKASERTEEELKGKKCYEVFHGTDQPPENCPLEKMLKSGRLEVVEMEMEALSGVFLVSCTPVFDDQGNVQRVIHIATDTTERKRAEESLKKSEQKLQSIIEHSNEIFYIHDTHHRFTYVSPQSLLILGYTPDEMMIEWIKLVSENPINIKGIEITEKALNTGERQKSYLLEVYKKDGRKVWLEIDESPLKDDKGNVIGIVGAARDITERKQMEDVIKDSEKKYRTLVDNSLVGIYRTNLKGEFLYTNDALTKIFEFQSREEMMAKTVQEIYKNPKDRDVLIENLKERGIVENFELEVFTKTGKTKNVLISASLEGDTISGMVHDITERKQARSEREKLIAELQEALKNVKTLSSLLPICMSCKKIRDDKGYWNQIEEYITVHTDTLFSHGLCPECLKKARYEFENLKKINKSE